MGLILGCRAIHLVGLGKRCKFPGGVRSKPPEPKTHFRHDKGGTAQMSLVSLHKLALYNSI